MTLVLSVLTRDFVVQVSDRHITDVRTGALLEDTRNKATLWQRILGLACSGLANIGLNDEDTDAWLANLIANCKNIDELEDKIRDEATKRFATFGAPSERTRHAFTGVGWGKLRGAGEPRPIQLRVANALDWDGRWLKRARPVFESSVVELEPPRDYLVCPPLGAQPTERELFELDRSVRKGVERGAGPVEIVRLVATVIGRVANRTSTVGRSLLAMAIPRPGRGSGGVTHAFTTQAALQSFKEGSPVAWNVPANSDEMLVTYANLVIDGHIYTHVHASFPVSRPS